MSSSGSRAASAITSTKAARVAGSGQGHRPLLADDPEGTLARLDAERAPLYAEVATRIVDVDDRSVESLVDEVLA